MCVCLRPFEAADPQAGEDEVQDEEDQVDVGHEGDDELDAPDTAVPGTVFGPRVVPEAVQRPEDGGRGVEQDRDHQKDDDHPVDAEREAVFQLGEDVGDDDDGDDGERDHVGHYAPLQRWLPPVPDQGDEDDAADEGLQDLQEARQRRHVRGRTGRVALVPEGLDAVEQGGQDGEDGHHHTPHVLPVGVEVSKDDSAGEGGQGGHHGHAGGEVVPVHAQVQDELVDEQRLYDGDEEGQQWAQGPDHHAVDPVGVRRLASDGTHYEGQHAQGHLEHVQGAPGTCQRRRRELHLVHSGRGQMSE